MGSFNGSEVWNPAFWICVLYGDQLRDLSILVPRPLGPRNEVASALAVRLAKYRRAVVLAFAVVTGALWRTRHHVRFKQAVD